MGKLRVLLIRHGESHNNVLLGISRDAYRKGRMADPPLSERGRLQAEHAALFLSSLDVGSVANALVGKVDELYCSPVLRAMETCLPISKRMGLKPFIWSDCYEHGGLFDRDVETGKTNGVGGLSESAVRTRFPNFRFEKGAFSTNGWYEGGYETQKECSKRAQGVCDRFKRMALESVDEDKTIALVAHHDFLDVLLRHVLDIDVDVRKSPVGTRFRHFNTAMTCVEIIPSRSLKASLHEELQALPGRGEAYRQHVTSRILFMNMVRHLPGSLVSWAKLGVV